MKVSEKATDSHSHQRRRLLLQVLATILMVMPDIGLGAIDPAATRTQVAPSPPLEGCVRPIPESAIPHSHFLVATRERECTRGQCIEDNAYYSVNFGRTSKRNPVVREIVALRGLDVARALECLQSRSTSMQKETTTMEGFGEISPNSLSSPHAMTFLLTREEEALNWDVKPQDYSVIAVKKVSEVVEKRLSQQAKRR